jgi:hypothetical protein
LLFRTAVGMLCRYSREATSYNCKKQLLPVNIKELKVYSKLREKLEQIILKLSRGWSIRNMLISNLICVFENKESKTIYTKQNEQAKSPISDQKTTTRIHEPNSRKHKNQQRIFDLIIPSARVGSRKTIREILSWEVVPTVQQRACEIRFNHTLNSTDESNLSSDVASPFSRYWYYEDSLLCLIPFLQSTDACSSSVLHFPRIQETF